MRHIKTFESINLDTCYRFNNKAVKIVSFEELSSSEISVSFIYEDGTIGHFNDTYKDFEEVFISIPCDNFTPKFNKSKSNALKSIITQPHKTPPKISEERYNVVYYVGNKLVDVIQKSIPSKLAYALKHTYKRRPEYRTGRIEVEKA